jgi:hypothetical protein
VAVLTGGIDVMRVEEGVLLCSCPPSLKNGSRNGGTVYRKCNQNLMINKPNNP